VQGGRRSAQPDFVPSGEIKQALLDEWIRIFSKAPAPFGMLFQK
jgi:hypothetical protein